MSTLCLHRVYTVLYRAGEYAAPGPVTSDLKFTCGRTQELCTVLVSVHVLQDSGTVYHVSVHVWQD